MEYHNMSIDELARQAEHDDNKLALQILEDLEGAAEEDIEEAVSEALTPLEAGIERAICNLEDIDEDWLPSDVISILEDLLK